MIKRRQSKKIMIGQLPIGGDAPVAVQSMTNTDTRDVNATVAQIQALINAGCELVRVAVPDMVAAKALREIKSAISIPLIADIHFQHQLAIEAVNQGVDALRLNPGNIGSDQRVREVVHACRDRGIPIRIGVNAGSLEKDLVDRFGHTPRAMVDSALRHIHLLEDQQFNLIKVSLKSSNVTDTIDAYRLLAEEVDYPFHIGITEAGTPTRGAIKSAVGIGILLYLGLGDTLRVSLTGDPVQEIFVAYQILQSLALRQRGIELISCPTCGRTEINLIDLATAVEKRLQHIRQPIKVAVMGCVVNGPGESRTADIGIAGGRGNGLLFRHGEILRKVPEDKLLDELVEEVEKLAAELSH
ncbi:MAG TPA: flavodoxin-dependent (E)-4-hydroxy-3-methylbut-2-enyl-diphosphate synthase, partial [Proteobacteria bacterium]|nr:flavodoxin-dependent (E)-4-hydroxy-3-methylbut-2-enyl-diphosphate synthase [Pseudomonadota bacterium]